MSKLRKQQRNQWLVVAGALLVTVGVVLYNGARMNTNLQRPLPPGQTENTAASVEIVAVTSGHYQATVTAYGNARARFQLTLEAQVSGEVVALSPQLETGERVQQGEVLLQLDDRDYQASLASARSDLASAQVSLLEEEREGDQALAEWQSAGLEGEPDSELVFRQPQLAAARAALEQSRTALASAQRDLDSTRVKAPFNALVVERVVAPGSQVQAGTELATLYSSDSVEITLQLSPQQWQNLPHSGTVALKAVNGSGQWQGRILRRSLNLDEATRQRSLVVSVDAPLEQTPALLPGTFVEATLSGTGQDGLWRLPATALSQRSEVWYVTEHNTLASFPAQVLFSDQEGIYVQPPAALSQGEQQVLVHPLNSYLQGMRVNATQPSRPAQPIGKEADHG